MESRHWTLIVIVALLSGGLTPFLVAVLKRRPEVRQMDATATAITIQGAETTVTILMRSLERAEAREAALEVKLADRERKIDELETRLDHLAARLRSVTVELEEARRQLANLHN
jgi:septal ring factor EnvC (AmiA/AmiB activator)